MNGYRILRSLRYWFMIAFVLLAANAFAGSQVLTTQGSANDMTICALSRHQLDNSSSFNDRVPGL
jgi:hypothetical protein